MGCGRGSSMGEQASVVRRRSFLPVLLFGFLHAPRPSSRRGWISVTQPLKLLSFKRSDCLLVFAA